MLSTDVMMSSRHPDTMHIQSNQLGRRRSLRFDVLTPLYGVPDRHYTALKLNTVVSTRVSVSPNADQPCDTT